MLGVTISEFIQEKELINMTPEIDTDSIIVKHPDVNRPALQLTGFFKHFDSERVQILGHVEYEYLNQLDVAERKNIFDKLLAYKVPCIVYARGLKPSELIFCF